MWDSDEFKKMEITETLLLTKQLMDNEETFQRTSPPIPKKTLILEQNYFNFFMKYEKMRKENTELIDFKLYGTP